MLLYLASNAQPKCLNSNRDILDDGAIDILESLDRIRNFTQELRAEILDQLSVESNVVEVSFTQNKRVKASSKRA